MNDAAMTDTQIQELRNVLSDVYRDMRNVVLTKKYYESKLAMVQRVNLWYEGILAFGTSATVAAWSIWQEAAGERLWVAIGVVVALLSIIKPVVKLSDEVKRLTSLATKYAALQIDFQKLIFKIKYDRAFNDRSCKTYLKIFSKMKDIGEREDADVPANKLRKFAKIVNQEFPATSFWAP